jgi:hypothetical protein
MELHAFKNEISLLGVIPAKAGIQENVQLWTPAFSGVTTKRGSWEVVKFPV